MPRPLRSLDWRRSPLAAPAAHTAASSSGRALPTPTRSTFSWRRRARRSSSRRGSCSGGSRGRGLEFADIVVSIPPDSARQPGEMQLPSSPPGDPEREFVILRADRMDLAQARANFDMRVRRAPGRRVLIFVHGYNTRFEEAVYRFAQIVHDARVNVAPGIVHLAVRRQPDRLCLRPRQRLYSRDALETVLQALAKDPSVNSIIILAHSMGNYLVVESLRQMAIRDRGSLAQDPRRDDGVAGHRHRRLPPSDRGNRRRAAAGLFYPVRVARRSRSRHLKFSRARFDPRLERSIRLRSLTGRFSKKAECRSST